MTRQSRTVEDRARFLLEAAEDHVRRAEEELGCRAKAIARRDDEWNARVHAGVSGAEKWEALVDVGGIDVAGTHALRALGRGRSPRRACTFEAAARRRSSRRARAAAILRERT